MTNKVVKQTKNNCHTEALYDTEESFKGTQGRTEC